MGYRGMRVWMVSFLIIYPVCAAQIVVNLEKAISSALIKNPEIKEAHALVGVSEGQLDEAKAAQYPKIETLSFMAPIFKITGNALDSSEITGNALGSDRVTDVWGHFFKSEGKGYIPLYTWNKISS